MSFEDVEPSPEELEDLSAACTRLWGLDENRLVAGQDYTMNLQVRKPRAELTSHEYLALSSLL